MSTITTNILQAIQHLQQGEAVAIPTETVYGLAANAENELAIAKVFALKHRPLSHPLIMHIHKDWDLNRWVKDIPDYVFTLINHFWPGPLTFVLPIRENKVHPLITGGQSTVAIRCPKHPLVEELLQTLNFPLVAPSANPFGKVSPTTAEHVQQSFKEEPLLILDGGRCSIGIESTILAATDPQGYRILRPGIISEESIQTWLPLKYLDKGQDVRVPGALPNHYQPEKPLYTFTHIEDLKRLEKFYVLTFSDLRGLVGYQLPKSVELAAFELYYQLRQADLSDAEAIAIELPPEEKSWEAIRERIIKASSGHI